MGKNQRHKKALKADKAKTKLKQTKAKFLPKGQNVTNTTFKIKPIVLVEQLKTKDQQAILSRSKLDVKDLLSRMKHYNENIRQRACEELVDVIKSHSGEVVNQHLSQLVLGVSHLFQDKDAKVRKAAAKVVTAILEVSPEEKLAPFYNYFLTNLRCAMTNINKNIQEDSLMFLDCFLAKKSKLITRNPEKLLLDFIGLISKQSTSKLGRTLSVNLDSQMSSMRWRIKVLYKLHVVLSIIMSGTKSEKSFEDTTPPHPPRRYGLYKTKLCQALSASNSGSFDGSEAMSASIEKYIVMVVPLLQESWTEVMPDAKTIKKIGESTPVDAEVAVVLTVVVQIFYTMLQFLPTNSLDMNLKEISKLPASLLTNFPYSLKDASLKIPAEYTLHPECLTDNIFICYFYLMLSKNSNLDKGGKKTMDTIVVYIRKCLINEDFADKRNFDRFIEMLKLFFRRSRENWKSDSNLMGLLEDTICLYDRQRNELCRTAVLDILIDLRDIPSVSRNPRYVSFIQSLPDLLYQYLGSEVTVNKLMHLSRLNIEAFHAALLDRLGEILGKLGSKAEDGALESIETQKNLVNVFFHIPKLDRKHLKLIREFVYRDRPALCSGFFEKMLELRRGLKDDEVIEMEFC